MNESILNALLQLFAIIANVSKDGVSFKARNIVKSYLSQHLSAKLINKYLKLFGQYIQDHHPEIFDKETKGTEITISSSDKVPQIGEEINRNLLHREKYIVFLRLVEFINEDEVMTQKELDFIKTVADTFNIRESSHNNTRAFVLNPLSPDIEKDKILVIDDNPEPAIPDVKHISKNNLDGRIVVLRHATTNTYVFRYSGKSNLYLNGHNIFPGRIGLMEQGAMITGHKITPIYYSDISRKFHHSETAAKIYFTAENIEFRFSGSTKGIKKFNFAKESGNLIGIMGGSGVGKSTLLNILSGKLKPQNGRILINGIDIHKNKEKLEGMIGFVPQDDLLIEDLTVFQNLYFNARLCFNNFSEKVIIKRVNKVLIDLELDDIKHLKVGNPLKKIISGGQRKRLNIALELIREPLILFADEPTSGLSSMDSEKVMFLLKEQTIKGKLVIVNIHQPFSDIFKLFERIVILDKGGYTIFKGNPIDALIYFKSLSDYVNAEEGQCLYCGNVTSEEILQIVEAREVDEYGKLTKERKV
ncbi:MAG: ATP-binding cassette domain-containing protein, partial [Bacteroidales bacterium]|nr:ATP-binding cassette domain-containing protein [Bacteroidales bacterium]